MLMRVERTHRDVRLDGADHYFAIFQVAGQSAMTHNEQALRFDVGDVVLVDVARPATFFAAMGASRGSPWPFFCRGGRSFPISDSSHGAGLPAQRNGCRAPLLDLIRNSGEDEGSRPLRANSHMRFAVYDLVGALFAPSDPAPSRHADKLFMRVRGVIKDGFADPDFCPYEAAARAGISLRYLQKLFTQRGSTCSEFIYSFRLDHAARLLHRRIRPGRKSTPQRDCLCFRFSRLQPFREKISTPVRSRTRRALCRRKLPP